MATVSQGFEVCYLSKELINAGNNNVSWEGSQSISEKDKLVATK